MGPSPTGSDAVGSSGSEPAGPAEAWPRIGLPTYAETARWGAWDRPAALLPHSYIAAVAAAGGLPVMLPPMPVPVPAPRGRAAGTGAGGGGGGSSSGGRAPGPVGSALDGIDALLLTGGADLDPARYGAEPLATTQAPRPDRDAWELALLAGALDRDLPVLAVCRGAEVLDVALGGTLHQHLPDVVGHDGHLPEPGMLGTTRVRLKPGSLAATVLGNEIKVACHHHQAIDRPGAGVEAVGWADDGTIEAVVVGGHRFALAAQWHPEETDDGRLFEALVAAAQERW
jgi:gamma-glutamyl-gamma-aminobutyrate hydrolase PuuD